MSKVLNFVKQLYAKLEEVDVFGLAAQLAYFFLLSLFPFLLFLLTLVGYLPFDDIAILDMIRTYAPAQIVDLIDFGCNRTINVKLHIPID